MTKTRVVGLLLAALLLPGIAAAQFTIPNYSAATHKAQAAPDSGDFAIITAAIKSTGVVSGCAVTPQGTPDMTVAVASGVVQVLGVSATVTGANATITAADATHPRFDLVTANASGVLSVVAGTPAATPEFPTTSNVVLATVYVPVGTTSIAAGNIVDKRAMVPASVLGSNVGQEDFAVLQAELVTNGTFTTNINPWTGTNWAYSAGTALHTTGSTAGLTQNITVFSGAKYQVEFTISGVSAGSVSVTVGAVGIYYQGATVDFDQNGTWRRSLIGGADGTLALTITPTSTFNGAIDDVSVKVVAAWPDALADAPVFDLYDSDGTAMAGVRGNVAAHNFGMGYDALKWITTGTYNHAWGHGALVSVTTGVSNHAFGYVALSNTTTGDFNTAVGDAALNANTTGASNTAVGLRSLATSTTAIGGTAVGDHALYLNLTGSYNTGVGFNSLYTNSTGTRNTGVGYLALNKTTVGDNTAVGALSGYTTAGGAQNTFLGTYSGYLHTSGDYDVCVGSWACVETGATPSTTNALTTGSRNTFIGNRAGLGSATQRTNSTAIGNEAYVSADNTIALGDENVTTVNAGSAAQAMVASKGWTITATAFAGLGTPADGTFVYCSDCTIASPCAGSGTGALAKRLNGAWVCN